MSDPPTALHAPPASGTDEELRAFAALQERGGPLFARVFPNPRAPRTVVVNLDLLGKIPRDEPWPAPDLDHL